MEAGDNQSLKVFKWRGQESNPSPLASQAKSLTTRPPLLLHFFAMILINLTGNKISRFCTNVKVCTIQHMTFMVPNDRFRPIPASRFKKIYPILHVVSLRFEMELSTCLVPKQNLAQRAPIPLGRNHELRTCKGQKLNVNNGSLILLSKV